MISLLKSKKLIEMSIFQVSNCNKSKMGLLKLKSCLCFELKIGVMAIGIFLSVVAVLQAIFAIVTMIVRIISGLSGGIHIICATVQAS